MPIFPKFYVIDKRKWEVLSLSFLAKEKKIYTNIVLGRTSKKDANTMMGT